MNEFNALEWLPDLTGICGVVRSGGDFYDFRLALPVLKNRAPAAPKFNTGEARQKSPTSDPKNYPKDSDPISNPDQTYPISKLLKRC